MNKTLTNIILIKVISHYTDTRKKNWFILFPKTNKKGKTIKKAKADTIFLFSFMHRRVP